MKNLIFSLIFLFSLIASAEIEDGLVDATELLPLSSVSSSSSWTDLGSYVYTGGIDTVGLWLSVGINDSSNFRVKMLQHHSKTDTSSTYWYEKPIVSASEAASLVTSTYYELTEDQDQRTVLVWDLDRMTNYVKFQYSVGTAGESTARVYSGKVTKAIRIVPIRR